jgi:hypothetical protein
MELKFFTPDTELDEQNPLVIGLPGFLDSTEKGRIDDVLNELKQYGVLGCGVAYSGATREQLADGHEKLSFVFSLKQYVTDLETAMDFILKDRHVDHNKVGVFASSIGGIVFASYIAGKYGVQPVPINTLVTLSPVTGWDYYQIPQARAMMKQAGSNYFEISTKQDKENKKRRLLSVDWDSGVEQANGLDCALESSPIPHVLTMVGTQDKDVCPDSIVRFHEALRGKQEHIYRYNCGHAIPNDLVTEGLSVKDRIVEFFLRSLF